MAGQARSQIHWMNFISALFVALTVLVAGWFISIWLMPNSVLNPFPPDAFASLPAQSTGGVQVVRAVYDPSRPTPTFPPTWTPTPLPPATATRLPTSTPLPTATPTAVPTLSPNWPLWITGMRYRTYEGGQVTLYGLFGESDKFTTYLIFYPSEGMSISGMMNVPKGRGPFPVIILCHGYIHPDKYATGNDTWREAFFLSEHGYITISPDYRSHAGSDNGTSFFHIGYAQDILNLIGSLRTVDHADTDRIGLWGHSMGGGVALKTAVVSKKVDALVLFGSVHADERVNFQYGMGNGAGTYGLALIGTPNQSRLDYKRISAINYLKYAPPISIHHGDNDMIVPYQWSEDLLEAAQEQNATAELFLYKGAEHTFRNDDWDLAMERTLAFFDKYVKSK
ncbi:MAG: alpha/beta fold hydrolase [Anaerolineae bacterium]|nr:alpha/beta fold hydrolase [Anaerolineae bacterium]